MNLQMMIKEAGIKQMDRFRKAITKMVQNNTLPSKLEGARAFAETSHVNPENLWHGNETQLGRGVMEAKEFFERKTSPEGFNTFGLHNVSTEGLAAGPAKTDLINRYERRLLRQREEAGHAAGVLARLEATGIPGLQKGDTWKAENKDHLVKTIQTLKTLGSQDLDKLYPPGIAKILKTKLQQGKQTSVIKPVMDKARKIVDDHEAINTARRGAETRVGGLEGIPKGRSPRNSVDIAFGGKDYSDADIYRAPSVSSRETTWGDFKDNVYRGRSGPAGSEAGRGNMHSETPRWVTEYPGQANHWADYNYSHPSAPLSPNGPRSRNKHIEVFDRKKGEVDLNTHKAQEWGPATSITGENPLKYNEKKLDQYRQDPESFITQEEVRNIRGVTDWMKNPGSEQVVRNDHLGNIRSSVLKNLPGSDNYRKVWDASKDIHRKSPYTRLY